MPKPDPAVHCPFPDSVDSSHPRPWCRNIRGQPTLAKPGQVITCRACITRNGGSEVYQAAHTAMMADPASTAQATGVDPRSVQTKHGLKALAREHRVRVTRTVVYEGGTEAGCTALLQRSSVVFNGSAAAFAIWSKGNTMLPTDKVERGVKGQWNAVAHTFDGLGPAEVGVREVGDPVSAVSPRRVALAALYGVAGAPYRLPA